MFDCSVFEFRFSGIIWGVFEFRIYLFGGFISAFRVLGFEFYFWRIICCVSEFRNSFIEENTIVLFVDVALRAASILNNREVCI